jgi:hypothetical protein
MCSASAFHHEKDETLIQIMKRLRNILTPGRTVEGRSAAAYRMGSPGLMPWVSINLSNPRLTQFRVIIFEQSLERK